MSLQTINQSGLTFGDSKSVIVKLVANGWKYQSGSTLNRKRDEVFIEGLMSLKVGQLNPTFSSGEVDESIRLIKRTLRGTNYQNLPTSNQSLMKLLKGEGQLQKAGEFSSNSPYVNFIDFDNLANNSFIVSDYVKYFGWEDKETTFDLVLWVNGIPLVVGEVEDEDGTPWVSSEKGTWVEAARSIAQEHESQVPEFFGTNVFSFAIGKDEKRGTPEFRFGAVRCEVERWERWGSTQDGTPFNLSGSKRVIQSISLLLDPKRLLSIISDFTLYQPNQKITPRYPQVEAVEAIYERALKPGGKQGLVIQHQGTGKTLAMAFAAIKLSKATQLNKPMIVVVADRIDLIDQAYDQFQGVSMVNLCKAKDKSQLQKHLSDGNPKVLVTTIHKFRNIGEMNANHNIIVLIDEAHRTQEGSLGKDMRTALPNARFFGFTGTPIADKDRNTFELFGERDDKDWVLNEYPPERSLADGTIVEIRVDPRVVNYHLSASDVEAAFNDLVQENELDEDEASELSYKVGRKNTALTAPERITNVCEAIVKHFYEDINPTGMKAQIVVYDRSMCIAYSEEIDRILARDNKHDETAVVMSSSPGDTSKGWSFNKRPAEVSDAIKRFNDHADNLKFLIVTSKLCTGFDAPIEGVMYLDKPLKAHTLFQTISRVNRKWTHPSGYRKEQGVVVDFIGLGEEIAKSLTPVKHGLDDQDDGETTDYMIEMLGIRMESCLSLFDGLPISANTTAAAMGIAMRNPEAFIKDFKMAVSIWSKLHPNDEIEVHKVNLAWLSKVYELLAPKDEAYDSFMKELGEAVIALTHEYLTNVSVDQAGTGNLIMDGEAVSRLRELEFHDDIQDFEAAALEDAFREAIADMDRRMARHGDRSPYIPLAERLEYLYDQYIQGVLEAAKTLRDALLAVVQDISMIEKIEDDIRTVGDDYLDAIMRGLTAEISSESLRKIRVSVTNIAGWISRGKREVHQDWVESAARVAIDVAQIKEYNPGLPSVLYSYIMELSLRQPFEENNHVTVAR